MTTGGLILTFALPNSTNERCLAMQTPVDVPKSLLAHKTHTSLLGGLIGFFLVIVHKRQTTGTEISSVYEETASRLRYAAYRAITATLAHGCWNGRDAG